MFYVVKSLLSFHLNLVSALWIPRTIPSAEAKTLDVDFRERGWNRNLIPRRYLLYPSELNARHLSSLPL